MKKSLVLLAALMIFTVFLIPRESSALGLEIGVGYWWQEPSGDFKYEGNSFGTSLDVEDDLNYDTESKAFGRLKADMPLFFPNIYLMATPMEFDESSQTTFNFKFGDIIFNGTIPFDSRLQWDHYDVALYYSIPLLKTATLNTLNIDLGLDARIIDFEAEVEQSGVKEEESFTFVLPMIYVGVQVRPIDLISLEADAFGISYDGNYYYDIIGRLKIKPVGPLYIAGGYRSETINVDSHDIDADMEFSGPFVEAGLEF